MNTANRCGFPPWPTVVSGSSEEAIRERHTHLQFLDALLLAELEERQAQGGDPAAAGSASSSGEDASTSSTSPRLRAVGLPDPVVSDGRLSCAQGTGLVSGRLWHRQDPPGDGIMCGGLSASVAKCALRRLPDWSTELLEAQHQNQLGRALSRWARYDLVCIDELGYVPLAELGAELLFQVISERAEKASVMITTNLPFSEWTKVFTNARLCKALLDRLTDRAHIIETGSESFRFRRTLERRNGGTEGAEALRNASGGAS